MSAPDGYRGLLPDHAKLLAASAISPAVAAARGYRSVTDPAELAALGFADYQCRTPALLIPLWDVSNQNGSYLIRPDTPRVVKDKPRKYEQAAGSHMSLDVPPSVRPLLADPSVPLWITEGSRKVDAAVSAGLACIGVVGVWGWRGTNEHGGKTALADWESIALNGRVVMLAFDSDVLTKPGVHDAVRRLGAFLENRSAHVRYVILPAGDDGTKVGLDDYLAAGGTVAELESLIVDTLPAPSANDPEYPIWAFPPKARTFIQEAAAALDAPPEMIGLPLLTYAAAAIGNTRYLSIKRGWSQWAALWGCVVGDPGTAKTPCIDAARGPLTALQRKAKATWDDEQAAYERALADWLALDKVNRALIAKPTPPVMEHFYSTDSTKEALAVMAAASAGVTITRDELTAWTQGFDAYRSGRGGDRQDMLSLWSGTPLKIDRKGADPIWAERPAVSIIGGAQPDRLTLLAGEAGQDGFLDRFLWVYADVPPMRWRAAEIQPETEAALNELFTHLRVTDAHDGSVVRLASEARARFAEWFDDNADAQAVASPLLRGTFAKLPTQLARVALVLHCMHHPTASADQLSLATLEGAIALIAFHVVHAERVLRRIPAAQPDDPLKVRIVRILRTWVKTNVDGWGTYSDLLRALGNVKTGDLRAGMDGLLADEAVETRAIGTATKSATEWRLTPDSDKPIGSKDSNYSNGGVSQIDPARLDADVPGAAHVATTHSTYFNGAGEHLHVMTPISDRTGAAEAANVMVGVELAHPHVLRGEQVRSDAAAIQGTAANYAALDAAEWAALCAEIDSADDEHAAHDRAALALAVGLRQERGIA